MLGMLIRRECSKTSRAGGESGRIGANCDLGSIAAVAPTMHFGSRVTRGGGGGSRGLLEMLSCFDGVGFGFCFGSGLREEDAKVATVDVGVSAGMLAFFGDGHFGEVN